MNIINVNLKERTSNDRMIVDLLKRGHTLGRHQNESSPKPLYLWFVPSKTLNHRMLHQLLKSVDERVLISELTECELEDRLKQCEDNEVIPDGILLEDCRSETLQMLKRLYIKIIHVESVDGLRRCSSSKNKVVFSENYASSVRALESCLEHARIGVIPEVFDTCFGVEFHAEKTVITPVSCLNVVWSRRVSQIFGKIPGQRIFVDLNEVDLLDASGLLALTDLEHHISMEGGIVALKNISLKARNFLDAARECFPNLKIERFRLI
ncbi:MAG: hypothetical protein KC649_07430 [Candidatus Omnitrophica bacterium]|nr:hypothetical protein [Candidatus Omnitrophota bacterium]